MRSWGMAVVHAAPNTRNAAPPPSSRGAAARVVHGGLAVHKPLERGVALDLVLARHLLLLGGIHLQTARKEAGTEQGKIGKQVLSAISCLPATSFSVASTCGAEYAEAGQEKLSKQADAV